MKLQPLIFISHGASLLLLDWVEKNQIVLQAIKTAGFCNIKRHVDKIFRAMDDQGIIAILACIDNNDWIIFYRLL
jgi:hypothetical protein